MHRTNIYFSDRQWKELNRIAGKTGISTSELIRRILDEWLKKKGQQ